MIRAVIDTNVWVAGLLSSTGSPSRILDLTIRGIIVPIVSPAMLRELDDVLHRPELGLPGRDVAAVLGYLRLPGRHVVHVDPVEPERVCSDPDDNIFTGAAVAGRASHLVTGNTKHFPRSPWRSIVIVDPATFLARTHLPVE